MSEVTEIQKQRAYASGVSINFLGLVNLVVDVIPARKADKSTQFKVICPDCKEPHILSQRYLCEDDKHGPFALNETARAKEINGVLMAMTQDEIAAVKAAQLEANDLTVSVFSAEEVEESTRPSGSSYRLRPKMALSTYAMLVALIADTSKAFIGELNLRDNQKMFRIEAWKGQLVLQELIRPDELAAPDSIPATKYDTKNLKMLKELAESNIEQFDPEQFRNTVRERAAELDAQKINETPGTKKAAKKVKPVKDDDSALAALLEGALKNSASKKKKAS